MEKAFIDEMKAALEQEQQTVIDELESVSSADTGNHAIGKRDPKFPEYGADNYGENTNAPNEVNDYMINADTTSVLDAQKEEITAALQRIQNGTYGVCVHCGTTIDQERLRANPSADSCIVCAKSHL